VSGLADSERYIRSNHSVFGRVKFRGASKSPAHRDPHAISIFGELSPARYTENRGDESDLLGLGVCLAHHFQLSRGVSLFMAFQSGFCAWPLGRNRINYFLNDCKKRIAFFSCFFVALCVYCSEALCFCGQSRLSESAAPSTQVRSSVYQDDSMAPQ
jgi:hypothetical protein